VALVQRYLKPKVKQWMLFQIGSVKIMLPQQAQLRREFLKNTGYVPVYAKGKVGAQQEASLLEGDDSLGE